MFMKLMANTFKRTFDRRSMLIYIIMVSICSISSILFASMQRIANVNYVLLSLCGGLTGESDFAILFSLWIVPSMMMAFLSGAAADREYEGYRCISPRYENQNMWLSFEIINTVIYGIYCSILLISIGLLNCLLYGKMKFTPLSPSILNRAAVSFQYWISDRSILTELFVMTAVRFIRIGLIIMSARMLPKYHTQIGMMGVLIIELLSFVNKKKCLLIFTYFSACSAGVPLSFVLITGVVEILCIVVIVIALFRIAVKNGQI